jgi:hypothetical protein
VDLESDIVDASTDERGRRLPLGAGTSSKRTLEAPVWLRLPYREASEAWSGVVRVGACKHVIQSRFKRAGMRWKQPGFLNVLALRIARLNRTFQAFWSSRGLMVQTSG